MPLSFRLTISSLETVLTLLSKCIQRPATVTTSYHAPPKCHYLWPRWQQQPSAWSPSFFPHPVHFEPSSHHDYFDTQVWSGHFTANTLLFTVSASAQQDLVPGYSLTSSFATPLLLHCRLLAFALPWHLNHTSDRAFALRSLWLGSSQSRYLHITHFQVPAQISSLKEAYPGLLVILEACYSTQDTLDILILFYFFSLIFSLTHHLLRYDLFTYYVCGLLSVSLWSECSLEDSFIHWWISQPRAWTHNRYSIWFSTE